MSAVHPPLRLRRAVDWFAIALVCLSVGLAVANAAAFTWAAAAPLIASDNWTFVETFLRPAFERPPTLGDFLVKRHGLDHGQPLNKALMLVNARVFGLDYRFEAMVGVGFAALGLVTLLWCVLAKSDAGQRRDPVVLAAIAAVCAIYLSLNSSIVYTQSLVTMGFADYLLAFLVIERAWRCLQGGSAVGLWVAMFAYGVIGDNSATLTAPAVAAASLLAGWKLRRLRSVLVVVGTLALALLAARLVYAGLGEIRGVAVTPFDGGTGERLHALWGQRSEAWKWIVIPAASGVAYVQSLQFLLPAHWQQVQLALAVVVIAGHVWFWVTAWRTRPDASGTFAVALMVLFYLYVAGILYGRAYLAGPEYLDQPRYVSLYQFQILAMLLMAVSRRLAALQAQVATRQPDARFSRAGVLAISLALVALQWPLTRHAWVEAAYLQPYYRGVAAQFGALARAPTEVPPAECAPILVVCKMPAATRASTMQFLRTQRLSLFSPVFEAAHPDLVDASGLRSEISR